MARSQNAPDTGDLDIDQLFAAESTRRPPRPPQLIFTEPVDRTAHLFADEPLAPAGERPPDAPHAVAALPALPAAPVAARPSVPSATGLRVLQGTVGLLTIVVLILKLTGDGHLGGLTATDTLPRSASGDPHAPAASALPNPAEPLSAPEPGPDGRGVVTAPLSRAGATDAAALPGQATASPTPAEQAAADISFIPPGTVDPLGSVALDSLGAPVGVPVVESPVAELPRERSGISPGELTASVPAPAVSSAPAPEAGSASPELEVRRVLARYEAAYSGLDAEAAARLYPSIDRRALGRAFSELDSQRIQLEQCRIEVRQGAALATCNGTASWTPKVGGGAREQARQWRFDLRQVGNGWQIGTVRIQ